MELPILSDGTTAADSQGHEVVSFEPVNASIVFDEPDYTDVEAVAGERRAAYAGHLRALYGSEP